MDTASPRAYPSLNSSETNCQMAILICIKCRTYQTNPLVDGFTSQPSVMTACQPHNYYINFHDTANVVATHGHRMLQVRCDLQTVYDRVLPTGLYIVHVHHNGCVTGCMFDCKNQTC